MLARIAAKTLLYDWPKYAGIIVGITFTLCLVVLQTGFYQGFQRDITIIPDSFDADLWIASKGLLTFDYPVPIDDFGHALALQDPAVIAASRITLSWVTWRQADVGLNEMVVLVGYEPESGISFDTGSAFDPRIALQGPGHVMIDAKDHGKLGLHTAAPQTGELFERTAIVAGLMRDRRLFTTAPLVLMNFNDSVDFARLPEFTTHYIALKTHDEIGAAETRERLQARLPEYRVFTAQEMHNLSQNYWKSQTGIGPLMFLTAALAAVVGFLTVLATSYIIILQKLPMLAALRAIGASLFELGTIVAAQISIALLIGISLGGILIFLAVVVIEQTIISLVLAPGVVALAVVGIASASYIACIPALWKLARTDPAIAFRT